MSWKIVTAIGAVVAASITTMSVTSAAAAGPGFVNPGTIRGLNPQPLPPRWQLTNPGTIRGLNPQPLPPRTIGGLRR